MKYFLLMILIFINSLFANQQVKKKVEEDKKIINACNSGDAIACNSLGNIYFDLSSDKANVFIGILLHKKACKLGNEESCKIINDYEDKKYKSLFTDNETKILNFMIKEELTFFLQGNEPISIFKEYYNSKRTHIAATSNDIQLDYEKNEVGADLKYKNKDIVVSGEVSRISKDAFDSIYLDLKGGTNQFMPPKAYIEKEYIEWVSKLSKKDKIKLFCEKSSMVMGSAILNNCKPLDAVIEEKTNNIIDLIDKKEISALNEDLFIMGFTIKELSKSLKNNSKCYTSNDMNSCIKELNSVMPKFQKNFSDLKGLFK
ncbi:OB-fold protein [Aliarcobacter cibarius]|uniref:Uncharacterized protein n=1 Tax=Aliarcobacter cibarius TaxID=255507 RepID=A0A7L5JQ19_9BACT|nr:hypothetical protein [Aliarcobacter cibarius]QKJ27343.1 hypothetical protein ACBT_1437 [Aliarcobacter cibarius]TLT02930.1 hypothetical protein FE248_08610 [Aliarcobacter cibarius]